MENTALKGFLTKDTDEEVRIDVPSGTWIIRRADLESLSDWKDAPPHDRGKPVHVVVKAGAKIGMLTTVTVQPVERPMTLSEDRSQLVESKEYEELSGDWGNTHGFLFDEKTLKAFSHTTVCCWEEYPSHFECRNDDCG